MRPKGEIAAQKPQPKGQLEAHVGVVTLNVLSTKELDTFPENVQTRRQ